MLPTEIQIAGHWLQAQPHDMGMGQLKVNAVFRWPLKKTWCGCGFR
jgi:hypothetical protein